MKQNCIGEIWCEEKNWEWKSYRYLQFYRVDFIHIISVDCGENFHIDWISHILKHFNLF
jgi:hypothetical protein